MKTKTLEITVHVIVDENGNYAMGDTRECAYTRYVAAHPIDPSSPLSHQWSVEKITAKCPE